MGLNKKEILILAETNRGNYSVQIKSEIDGFWQVGIRVTNPDRYFDVSTSRGDLKTWRNLADAVYFVQETCKDCLNIEIAIGPWKFTRQD
jgi:hypothetical protein